MIYDDFRVFQMLLDDFSNITTHILGNMAGWKIPEPNGGFHRKLIGKSLENLWKIIGKSLENHRKIFGNHTHDK